MSDGQGTFNEKTLKLIIKKLVEELRSAYYRTPVTNTSWIHIRNAYMLALSLERLLENAGEEAQKQNTARDT